MFKLESRRFLCPLYMKITLEDQECSKEASQDQGGLKRYVHIMCVLPHP